MSHLFEQIKTPRIQWTFDLQSMRKNEAVIHLAVDAPFSIYEMRQMFGSPITGLAAVDLGCECWQFRSSKTGRYILVAGHIGEYMPTIFASDYQDCRDFFGWLQEGLEFLRGAMGESEGYGG